MVERIRALLALRQLTPTQLADLLQIGRPIVSHILSGRNKASLEVVQRIIGAFPEVALPWLLSGTGPMLTANATPAPAAAAVPAPAAPPFAPAQSVSSAATSAQVARTGRPASATAEARANAATRPAATAAPRRLGAVPDLRRFVATKELNNKAENSAGAGQPASDPVPPPAGNQNGFSAQGRLLAAVPAAFAPPTELAAPEAGPVVSSSPLAAPPPPTGAAGFLADKPIRRIVIFYRDGSFADFQPEPLAPGAEAQLNPAAL